MKKWVERYKKSTFLIGPLFCPEIFYPNIREGKKELSG